MSETILGNHLKVSKIGFGCMGLSHANGKPVDTENAITIIKKAYELGYTFFDTAETYGFKEDIHHNEKIVGMALKDVRENVVIATKFGVSFDYSKNPEHPDLIVDSSKEVILKSLEGSLKRLQTNYIDLYYQHRLDPNVGPEEVAEVMKELIQQGKIKHWGISMADIDYVKRAHAVCPVTAVENVYNLLVHDDTYLDELEKLGIGLVSCCPLAKGFLSNQYQKGQTFKSGDYRNDVDWFKDSSFDKNKQLLEYITELAALKNATAAQISLAWMINKKSWIVPIPGSRKTTRIEENIKAENVSLTKDEMNHIESLLG